MTGAEQKAYNDLNRAANALEQIAASIEPLVELLTNPRIITPAPPEIDPHLGVPAEIPAELVLRLISQQSDAVLAEHHVQVPGGLGIDNLGYVGQAVRIQLGGDPPPPPPPSAE